MTEVQRILRRVDHLKRLAGFVRLLTTISLIATGLVGCVATVMGTLAELLGVEATAAVSSVAFNVGIWVFMLGAFISFVLPHLLFYGLAEALLFFADEMYLQLNIMHRLGESVMPMEQVDRRGTGRKSKPEAEKLWFWE